MSVCLSVCVCVCVCVGGCVLEEDAVNVLAGKDFALMTTASGKVNYTLCRRSSSWLYLNSTGSISLPTEAGYHIYTSGGVSQM